MKKSSAFALIVSATLLLMTSCQKQNSSPVPVNASVVKIDVAAATAEVQQLELQKAKPSQQKTAEEVTLTINQMPIHVVKNGQSSLVANGPVTLTGDSILYLQGFTIAVGENMTFNPGADYVLFINGTTVGATVTYENNQLIVVVRNVGKKPLSSGQVNSFYLYGVPYGVPGDIVDLTLTEFRVTYKSGFYVTPTGLNQTFQDKFKAN